jgi:hypothetical protein
MEQSERLTQKRDFGGCLETKRINNGGKTMLNRTIKLMDELQPGHCLWLIALHCNFFSVFRSDEEAIKNCFHIERGNLKIADKGIFLGFGKTYAEAVDKIPEIAKEIGIRGHLL